MRPTLGVATSRSRNQESQPERVPLRAYGGFEPTLLVTEDDCSFTLGGVTFEIVSTPGAKSSDNKSLWLPEQKTLSSAEFNCK